MEFGIASPGNQVYPIGPGFLKTLTNAGDKNNVNSNLVAKVVLCLKVPMDFPVAIQGCLICPLLPIGFTTKYFLQECTLKGSGSQVQSNLTTGLFSS